MMNLYIAFYINIPWIRWCYFQLWFSISSRHHGVVYSIWYVVEGVCHTRFKMLCYSQCYKQLYQFIVQWCHWWQALTIKNVFILLNIQLELSSYLFLLTSWANFGRNSDCVLGCTGHWYSQLLIRWIDPNLQITSTMLLIVNLCNA